MIARLRSLSPKNTPLKLFVKNRFCVYNHLIEMSVRFGTLIVLLFTTWVLSACELRSPDRTGTEAATVTATVTEQVSISPEASPQPTLTSPPPTPTPVPLALSINGVPITLEEYRASQARLQAVQDDDLSPDEVQQRVLDEFISQVLLAQAADIGGFVVDDAMLEERILHLEEQLGSTQALAEWQADHGYTDESFRRELRRSVAAAWMRDQIIATVPDTAEQVRMRQILLFNPDDARLIMEQLESGVQFENLAGVYDPLGGGELGWFPRGYLTVPELEETAFSLQPGDYSQVIETTLGYHIVQVIERQPNRPLTPDAKLTLQIKAVETWLQEQRENSEIRIFLP